MNRRDIQKLLGGYATGTLTGAERELLFQAAAEDQEIFNALISEEPLREALADPAAKARLLAALDEPAPAWQARAMRWMWGHAVGVAAVGCFLAVSGYVAWQARHSQPPKVVYVAEMKPFSIDVPSEPEGKPAKATRPFDTSSINKVEARKAKMPPLPAAPPFPPAERVRDMAGLAAVIRSRPAPLPSAGPAPVPEASPVERALITGQLSNLQTQANAFAQGGNSLLPRAGALAGAAPNTFALTRADMKARTDAPQSPRALFYGSAPSPRVSVSAGSVQLEAAAQNVGEQVTIPPGNPYPSEDYIRPAIQFSILRRSASGDFERIDGTEVAAGDTVRLSIEANRRGALAVVLDGVKQPWLAAMLERQSPVLTTPVRFSRAGLHSVHIRFSTNTGADAVSLNDSTPQSQAETNASERATYVVAAPAAPLTYSFTLRWK